MNMILKLLIAVVIGSSSTAVFAQEPEDYLSPPKSIPTPSPYFDWKRIWLAGTPVTKAKLMGKWKLIGVRPSSSCTVQFPNEWNPNGVTFGFKKTSGLVFKNVINPEDQTTHFSVTANFGDDEQGPFEASEVEPQFSTWSYGFKRVKDWWEFSCHTNSLNDRQLVCASHLALPPDDREKNEDDLDCTREPIGGFAIYQKVAARKN